MGVMDEIYVPLISGVLKNYCQSLPGDDGVSCRQEEFCLTVEGNLQTLSSDHVADEIYEDCSAGGRFEGIFQGMPHEVQTAVTSFVTIFSTHDRQSLADFVDNL